VIVEVDTRWTKVRVDLVEVRFEILAGAAAVALGSLTVAMWQPPVALVLVGVLPLAALVIALGAARIGRARASEWSFLRAIGAGDGFAATLSRIEGGCFGAAVAILGLLVSFIVALAIGGATSLRWDVVWLVVATTVAMVSASIGTWPRQP
jgi:hypothetical protein